MEPFVGQLMLVGFNFAPQGWAKCEGQLLSIASNSALFSLLGTTYGGDGRSSFGLPDLRGRVPVGVGNGPGLPTVSWGEKTGNYQTNLITANLPAHNHTGNVNVSSANSDIATPTAGASLGVSGKTVGRAFETNQAYNNVAPNIALSTASITNNLTGSNIPFSNMQPYLGMSWVIALQGIYPSRS